MSGNPQPDELPMPDDVVLGPGVHRSFPAFYASEIRSVVGLAYALSGSRAAAEDLAQEAFSAAFVRWDRVGVYDNPGAFVRRVVANRTRLVAVGEERPSEIDGFTPLVLWSLDGQTWYRGDIEHSSEVDTRVHDVISIDGGFLAQGSTFASDAVTTGSYWASATGEVWKRVEIPGHNEMGTISYDQGLLRLFMTPSLEANSDRTGALEIWQGTIEVVSSP